MVTKQASNLYESLYTAIVTKQAYNLYESLYAAPLQVGEYMGQLKYAQ